MMCSKTTHIVRVCSYCIINPSLTVVHLFFQVQLPLNQSLLVVVVPRNPQQQTKAKALCKVGEFEIVCECDALCIY